MGNHEIILWLPFVVFAGLFYNIHCTEYDYSSESTEGSSDLLSNFYPGKGPEILSSYSRRKKIVITGNVRRRTTAYPDVNVVTTEESYPQRLTTSAPRKFVARVITITKKPIRRVTTNSNNFNKQGYFRTVVHKCGL